MQNFSFDVLVWHLLIEFVSKHWLWLWLCLTSLAKHCSIFYAMQFIAVLSVVQAKYLHFGCHVYYYLRSKRATRFSIAICTHASTFNLWTRFIFNIFFFLFSSNLFFIAHVINAHTTHVMHTRWQTTKHDEWKKKKMGDKFPSYRNCYRFEFHQLSCGDKSRGLHRMSHFEYAICNKQKVSGAKTFLLEHTIKNKWIYKLYRIEHTIKFVAQLFDCWQHFQVARCQDAKCYRLFKLTCRSITWIALFN